MKMFQDMADAEKGKFVVNIVYALDPQWSKPEERERFVAQADFFHQLAGQKGQESYVKGFLTGCASRVIRGDKLAQKIMDLPQEYISEFIERVRNDKLTEDEKFGAREKGE